MCNKINGLSHAKTNCSKYDEGKCLGACIQKESTEAYNQRVTKAIEKYSLADKNIVIVDKGRVLGEKSVILIKNGIFKGLGFCDLNYQINNLPILETIITPMEGNDNTNHIVETYLRKRKVQKIRFMKLFMKQILQWVNGSILS